MFWSILLIMAAFSVVSVIATSWLGMLIGEWALFVAGFLLAVGVVTACFTAYGKVMDRLDSIEKKLSKLTNHEDENE